MSTAGTSLDRGAARLGAVSRPSKAAIGLASLGALTVVATAIVHLYLWGKSDGYRAVPTIGPLFLVQGIVGCVLGVAIAVLGARRWIVAALGAAFQAASAGGLLLSVHGSLFGYQEALSAPWATFSLVDEIAGLVLLLALAAVLLLVQGRRPTPPD